MNNQEDYSKYFSSPELLANAILKQYKQKTGNLDYPINPFKILKSLGVKLVIRNFKTLEGLYLPATAEDDIDVVAINLNRPIYRQRYTAAHEICHYIKDRENPVACPISGKKSAIEDFADKFASALLMPKTELEKQVKKYINADGYIELKDVIYVSEYFGVSFEACVYNIAYKLHKIAGNTDSKELKRRIRNAHADKLRQEFGITNILNLTRELIEDYCYARPKSDNATSIKFKQYLVLNENRLEGIDIDESKINYILADIRLNNNIAAYGNEENPNILEAIGNIELLEYALNTTDKLEVWKLQKMQSLLYQYTPFGNELPFPRKENNIINGAQVSTVDYTLVMNELVKVEEKIRKLLDKKESISLHEYILEAIKIHHRLTVIHPLTNGNGRCSRAMLLWLLRLKNIPPIYIKLEDKSRYIEALNIIDTKGNYDYLELLILQEIIKSMVALDEKLEI